MPFAMLTQASFVHSRSSRGSRANWTTSLGVPDMAQRKFFVAFATLALSATLGCVVVASLAAQDKKGPSRGEKSAGEKTGEKPAADKAKEPAKVHEKTAAFDKLHR